MSKSVIAKPVSRPTLGRLTVLASSLLLIQMNAHANTVVDIRNVALADYGIGSTKFTTPSNAVTTKAIPKVAYAVNITEPERLTHEPNQEVVWTNVLTNTGFYDENVKIAISELDGNVVGQAKVYADYNGNGVADEDELIDQNIAISIKAGEKITLIVKAMTTPTAKDGDQAGIKITATVVEDNSAYDSATDRVLIVEPRIEYKTANYSKPVEFIMAGDNAYLEVGMALCNSTGDGKDYTWLNVSSSKTGDDLTLKAVETGNNTGKYRVDFPTELNAQAKLDDIMQTLSDDILTAIPTHCETPTGIKTPVGELYKKSVSAKIAVIDNKNELIIDKTANVRETTVGEFIDYNIVVQNNSRYAISNVQLKDNLPTGLGYVTGTVRLNGQKIDTDFVPSGKYITLGLGHIEAGQKHSISYRVRVGAAALAGDGINRAHVEGVSTLTGQPTASSVAQAKVVVNRDSISTDGIIIGKVYADGNRDGIQQLELGELGVAGVRLYLEDGTYAITDSEGKYSLYGIKATTHVIKLDRTTLPKGQHGLGVELVEQSNRNAGDAGSRFIDLKYGELHRADFGLTDALDGISEELAKELKVRAQSVKTTNTALEQAVKSTLELEPNYNKKNDDVNAEGCKDALHIDGQISCQAVKGSDVHERDLPKLTISPIKPKAVQEIELALSDDKGERIEGINSEAGFLNLANQERVDSHRIRVQIKAPKGADTNLYVNGRLIGRESIGKEVVWEEESISGFDYVAVPLERGSNELSVISRDSTGKTISQSSIHVYAPNRISDVKTRTGELVQADGKSEYQVAVSLTDSDGKPYVSATPVTLDATVGTITLTDEDKSQAGTQIIATGGEFLVNIKAPTAPAKGNLHIKVGSTEKIIPLEFTPELRPMITVGIIDGVLSLDGIERASESDGFERELRSLSGSDKVSGRSAFFLKGKVKGGYLLTMRYDSDKADNDRLFRDIRPDEYYPVYGDSSAKGFDAQSSEKLYVRVDKGRSFLMYGDLKTRVDNNDGLSLGQYDRTLTGVKAHFENDKTIAQAFVSETSTKQTVNETRGLGISGPYPLLSSNASATFSDVLLNSEMVEIITRDKNNPSIIVKRQALARFSDYEIDAVSGALYLRNPITSTDMDGNPIYLRVTVESDTGVGEEYIVGGANIRHRLNDKVSVGASYIQSDDPTNKEELSSVNAVIDVNHHVRFIAEMARYSSDELNDTLANQINANALTHEKDGQAMRAELNYKSSTTTGKLNYTKADIGFDPLSSPATAGRTEIGLDVNRRLNDKTRLNLEGTYSKDDTNGATRQGVSAAVERRLTDKVTAELGVRHYDNDVASANYGEIVTNGLNQSLSPSVTERDYHGTTVRAKVTANLPQFNKSKIFAEYEQDIEHSDRNAWAVGGETSLWDKGRLYARHELSSSLTGDYGLTDTNESNNTIIGVDANYMKDGQVFSEYRLKDGISARENEASIGLRNKFQVREGVYINTSLERLETLSGEGSNDATAVTFGVDYLPKTNYKASGRIEKRWGEQSDTLLSTLGYAYKASEDTTLLAKNHYSRQDDNTTGNSRTVDRFILGVAYRDYNSNIIDYLAKVEYRLDDNSLTGTPYHKDTYIASLHANYHPTRRLTLSSHYAGKWNKLDSLGVNSRTDTHLVSGRMMYDMSERWDVGMQAGTMWTRQNDSRYHLLGAEVGYSPLTNLWLSAGYNFMGYHDEDIADSQTNQKGGYVRLRFKFDETLFKRGQNKTNGSMMPTADEPADLPH